jgi:hypothetical protein
MKLFQVKERQAERMHSKDKKFFKVPFLTLSHLIEKYGFSEQDFSVLYS